jgi:hypothetical protein
VVDSGALNEFLTSFWLILLLVLAIIAATGALLLAIAYRQLSNLNIPPGAGFAETLHHTPFLVVMGIDLLDMGLDILAAPITWVLLDRMGLKALRNVSAVEAFIPGTQFIPTLTAAWIVVRLFNIGDTAISQYPDKRRLR